MRERIDLERRRLLHGRLPSPSRSAPGPSAPPRIRPPWSGEARIAAACTGCGACAEACPQGIVRLGEDRLPFLALSAGECTFCAACAAACPEPVFAPGLDPAAPPAAATAFSHRAAILAEDCLAAAGVHCQSCGDACPEAAIRFRPRIGGPPLPELSVPACTGCGACIATCPAGAVAPAFGPEGEADG